jgi:hypothetical protein
MANRIADSDEMRVVTSVALGVPMPGRLVPNFVHHIVGFLIGYSDADVSSDQPFYRNWTLRTFAVVGFLLFGH